MKLLDGSHLTHDAHLIVAGVLTAVLLAVFMAQWLRRRSLANIPLYVPLAPSELKSDSMNDEGETTQRTVLSTMQMVSSVCILGVQVAMLVHRIVVSNEEQRLVQILEAGCWLLAWLGSTALLTLERRHKSAPCRSLRLWWLAWWVYSTSVLREDLMAISDSTEYWLRIVRVASYAPTMLLALLAMVQRHTQRVPPDHTGGVHPSPEIGASLFSCVTFSWLNALLVRGAKQPLKHPDLNNIRPDDATCHNHARLQSAIEAQDPAQPLSLFRVLRSAYGWDFLCMVPYKLINDSVQYVNPVLIHAIVHIIESNNKSNLTTTYLLACCMFVASETQSIAAGQYFLAGFRLGLRTRGAVNQTVYSKGLRLSNAARKIHTEGAVLSYMQIDAQKLCDSIPYLHMVWSAPLQFAFCMLLLYRELGWSCFAGVLVLVALIPVNTKVATTQRNYTRATMKARDHRVTLLSEMLQAVRSIKMFAWEAPSMEAISARRAAEAKQIRGNSLFGAFSTFLWGGSPLLVTVCTFTVYTQLMDGTLTATKAFTSMALFNLLRFPLSMIPGSISRIIDISVVVGRLSTFLNAEEKTSLLLPPGAADVPVLNAGHYTSPEGSEHAIVAQAAHFSWAAVHQDLATGDNERQAPFELRAIDLVIRTGWLVGITGAVGTGKSSLLAGIANLMEHTGGSVVVRGRVAFCAQQPWIQNATLKQNVLFGRDYDDQRFRSVLHACALLDDIAMLADHEDTQIGERGVTLSGGQKARVALARACYVDADVYLLDDILSAVDSGVGEHIMENCIQRFLRGKTVLLATHHIQWLPVCDRIVHVDHGTIALQGSWNEVEQYVEQHLGVSSIKRTALAEEDAVSPEEHSSRPVAEASKRPNVTSATKEDQEEGMVKQYIWVGYTKALTAKLVVVTLVVYTLASGLQVGSSFWLSHWSNQADNPHAHSSQFYISVYAGLSIATMLLIWVRATAIALATIAAGRRMHSKALDAVFHTPTSYFDDNPLGRIINRFSSDLQVIDVQMRMTLQGMLLSLFNLISTVGVALAATPFLGLLLVPLGYLYYVVAKYYRHSSREVQRLTSTSLSPIYTAFAETLSGTDTISTFRDQPRFLDENAARMDRSIRAAFAGIAANRWLAIRLEFVGNTLVVATATLVVFEYSHGNINAGMAGLALSYVVTFTDYLNWLIRQFTTAETQMVAVERLDKLCHLESEPDPKAGPEFENWPATAEIEFESLSMKYRPELPLVLAGVTARIEEGERVGICGRTGSGKSTLLTMLFLMNRPLAGRIMIGGTDITTVPLRVLRSAIASIPQEPVLFSGTLRYNMDPFAKDDVGNETWILDALEQASLGEFVRKQERGLDMLIEAGGANLSVGQRQLVCLARALLRGAKILVLDEATASIDLKTDALIQEALLRNLDGKTVLTVAHRIDTILNYDRILYLENGKVAESGSPHELRKDPTSKFAQLCVGH
eukprot:TRINITY_DN27705_c0_g1_i1.p1 TRINITY_DN27705_c0_g1~~TRINITY_DN27705_c0_g1_i1.p1  ORF type:complete len:1461 (-),score=356.90 TRINITY_DN27705_c0_g1_i1:130-4512(-)